jgi:hypothetical protein
MERSEFEVVKLEIAEVKAKLTEAETAGCSEAYLISLNNRLTSLNNNLTELQKKENLLLAQASAGMSLLMVSLLILILFCDLFYSDDFTYD